MLRIKSRKDRLIGKIESEIAVKLSAAGLTVQRAAKDLVSVKSGETKDNIKVQRFRRKVKIGTKSKVGIYLELGTKPHIIEPKRKKALYWAGAAHPVALVRHPGAKQKPFLRPALLFSMYKIKKIFGVL